MKFWIDFEGYCSIEAETEEEAKEKFWEEIYPHSSEIKDEHYELNAIEED